MPRYIPAHIFSSPPHLRNNDADSRRNAGWGGGVRINVLIPWGHHNPGGDWLQGLSALRSGGGNRGSEEENKGHRKRSTAFAIFSGGG